MVKHSFLRRLQVLLPVLAQAILLGALAACAGPTVTQGSPLPATPKAIQFSKERGALRIALAGLVHQHCERLLLSASQRDDIEIVGVAEPNAALFERLAGRYGLDSSLRFATLEEMLAATRPEAVSAMTSSADHVAVVETCAPKGVHVLVEKPLAFTRADAERMGQLASEHGVLVLTNFETSWYRSVREARRRVGNGEFAPLRKMVFRHGHPGPIEIGCYAEFTDWLTSKEGNGGGALVDFGCYGAVLATWLMDGAAPVRVTAAAQTMKPDVYPQVDDDATILLEYPGASAVIESSWNWTHDVKEMDVFTGTGSLHAGRGDALTARAPDQGSTPVACAELPAHLVDEWTYLREVVRGRCEVDPLSSLGFNTTVAGILEEALRQVARADKKSRSVKRSTLPAPPRIPRTLGVGGRTSRGRR